MKKYFLSIAALSFIFTLLASTAQAQSIEPAFIKSPSNHTHYLLMGNSIQECSFDPFGSAPFDLKKHCKTTENIFFDGIISSGNKVHLVLKGKNEADEAGQILLEKDITIPAGSTNFRLNILKNGETASADFQQFFFGDKGVFGNYDIYTLEGTYQTPNGSNNQDKTSLDLAALNAAQQRKTFYVPFGWTVNSLVNNAPSIPCTNPDGNVSIPVQVQSFPNTSLVLALRDPITGDIIKDTSGEALLTDAQGKASYIFSNVQLGSTTLINKVYVSGFSGRKEAPVAMADVERFDQSIASYNLGNLFSIDKCPLLEGTSPTGTDINVAIQNAENVQCRPPINNFIQPNGVHWLCNITPTDTTGHFTAIARAGDGCQRLDGDQENESAFTNFLVEVSTQSSNDSADEVRLRSLAANAGSFWCRRGGASTMTDYYKGLTFSVGGTTFANCTSNGNNPSYYNIQQGERCFYKKPNGTLEHDPITFTVSGKDVVERAERTLREQYANNKSAYCNDHQITYTDVTDSVPAYLFSWSSEIPNNLRTRSCTTNVSTHNAPRRINGLFYRRSNTTQASLFSLISEIFAKKVLAIGPQDRDDNGNNPVPTGSGSNPPPTGSGRTINNSDFEFAGCKDIQKDGVITINASTGINTDITLSGINVTPTSALLSPSGLVTFLVQGDIGETYTISALGATCTGNIVSSGAAEVEVTAISHHSPLIYIYSKDAKTFDVSIENTKGVISYHAPFTGKLSADRTQVQFIAMADKDGIVKTKDASTVEYMISQVKRALHQSNYLFYEYTLAQKDNFSRPNQGFSVSANELESFLKNNLFVSLGLSIQEKNDYLADILPRLMKSSHYFIGFVDAQELKDTLQLQISPKVGNMHRIMLFIQPLESKVQVTAPDLSKFTVDRSSNDLVLELGVFIKP